nr:hypothetical protein BaRGS_004181 [Batillaria attramentaria]
MEDPRKRAAEGRKLRIDHSDVYLENEKLAEALDADLDNLSRLRHRQTINRDYEINKLRQALTSMNTEKKPSTPTFRPHTSPAYRRVRPPTVVQVKVHVPSTKDHHSNSSSRNISDSSDNDSDDDDSSDDGRKGKRRQFGRTRSSQDTAWSSSSGGAKERGGSSNTVVRKTTRQDMLLRQLGRKEVPKEWYTKVLPPSDALLRRRAASARPSLTPFATPITLPQPHPAQADFTPPGAGRRSRRQEGKPSRRPERRVKSAMPFVTRRSERRDDDDDDDDERCQSRLFCGGEQQSQKTGTTMSRRQLRELSAGSRGSDAPDVMNIVHRYQEVERIKRENLEAKVKLFVQSCDQVSEGGISSSRRSRDFQNFGVTPEALYS